MAKKGGRKPPPKRDRYAALGRKQFMAESREPGHIRRRKRYAFGDGAAAVDDWILATGFWRDVGFWRDTKTWID